MQEQIDQLTKELDEAKKTVGIQDARLTNLSDTEKRVIELTDTLR